MILNSGTNYHLFSVFFSVIRTDLISLFFLSSNKNKERGVNKKKEFR